MSVKKFELTKFLKSNKGGLSTIIAIVVSIIMVLSLISYAVLSQVAGVKATSDKASIEQQKINLMLQDSNIVPGSTVIDYYYQSQKGSVSFTVNISDVNDVAQNPDDVMDGALYRMTKVYNANGILSVINFKQVDLGTTR